MVEELIRAKQGSNSAEDAMNSRATILKRALVGLELVIETIAYILMKRGDLRWNNIQQNNNSKS